MPAPSCSDTFVPTSATENQSGRSYNNLSAAFIRELPQIGRFGICQPILCLQIYNRRFVRSRCDTSRGRFETCPYIGSAALFGPTDRTGASARPKPTMLAKRRVTMHPLPPSKFVGAIPSPFAPDGFFVMLDQMAARRVRLQQAVAQDIDELRLPLANDGSRITTAQLPGPVRAYRVLVRCALLSITHLYEVYDVHLNATLSRIRDLPDGAEDRSAVVRHFIDRLIQTMDGAPTDVAQLVSAHFAEAIEALVQSNWPAVQQTAVNWEIHRRVEDKRKGMLRKMRELRRLSQKST